MNKMQYMIEALQAHLYKHKAWIIAAFSVVREYDKTADYPYRFVESPNKDNLIYFIDPNNDNQPTPIEGSNRKEPLYRFNEEITVKVNDIPNVTEDTLTTYGRLLYNAAVLCYGFGNKIPFMNSEIKFSTVEQIIAARLKDNPDNFPSDVLMLPEDVSFDNKDPNKIYVFELLRYAEACSALAGLTPLVAPSATAKSMTVDPAIIKYRNERLKSMTPEQLKDPAEIAKLEAELVAMDKATFKGDPAEKFYLKNKDFEINRKRMYLLFGVETGFNNNPEGVNLIIPSLKEGWDLTQLPGMVNSLRSGSYNRGHQTALGGESVKFFYRIFQNTRVAEEYCGTKSGLEWTVTEANVKQFIGRYMIDSKGNLAAIPVTQETFSKELIGKKILVASPMMCKTKPPSFCARCVGDTLAATPTGLHVATSDVGSTFMGSFMQKMHGTALKTLEYNFLNAYS